MIHDAEGYTDEELYVKAKRLIKTGPDRYTAQDGFLTACQEAVPKWSFTIRQASIEQGGNARFSHTFLKVKKVPVFYLPYMLFPTGEKERSSGFLIPTMGNSKREGIANQSVLLPGAGPQRRPEFSYRLFFQAGFRKRSHLADPSHPGQLTDPGLVLDGRPEGSGRNQLQRRRRDQAPPRISSGGGVQPGIQLPVSASLFRQFPHRHPSHRQLTGLFDQQLSVTVL